ncbi:MAG: twin-arginine translocase TatA/TatE family subunit [Solirubrobacterales bacterium]
MPNIGPLEIGIVLVIALIVFGPKKLPDLGRSLGKGIREFKGSISGDEDEAPKAVTQQATNPAPPTPIPAPAPPTRQHQNA